MITFVSIQILRYITPFTGADMPRFSGRKPFTQDVFNRHVDELRSLLNALESRDSFENSETRPRMDIYETGQEIIIEFDLPGFALDAISLKISGLTLTLDASRPRDTNEGTFICVERGHGHCNHRVHIPGNIDPALIRAEYRRGVLRVVCPKSRERSVPIQELL